MNKLEKFCYNVCIWGIGAVCLMAMFFMMLNGCDTPQDGGCPDDRCPMYDEWKLDGMYDEWEYDGG